MRRLHEGESLTNIRSSQQNLMGNLQSYTYADSNNTCIERYYPYGLRCKDQDRSLTLYMYVIHVYKYILT